MTRSHVWHDSSIINCHMCDVTRAHVWHDSFTRAICLVHMCDVSRSYVWHDSFTCVTWLVYHQLPCAWHASFPWLIHMTRSHVRRDAIRFVTRLIHTSQIWRDHMCDMNESCHTHKWVMSHIWMSHVTHMIHTSHLMSHSFIRHKYGAIWCATWLIHDMAHLSPAAMHVTCLVHTCDTTHSNARHTWFWKRYVTLMNEACMGWLRFVGSLKS